MWQLRNQIYPQIVLLMLMLLLQLLVLNEFPGLILWTLYSLLSEVIEVFAPLVRNSLNVFEPANLPVTGLNVFLATSPVVQQTAFNFVSAFFCSSQSMSRLVCRDTLESFSKCVYVLYAVCVCVICVFVCALCVYMPVCICVFVCACVHACEYLYDVYGYSKRKRTCDCVELKGSWESTLTFLLVWLSVSCSSLLHMLGKLYSELPGFSWFSFPFPYRSTGVTN